MLFIVFSLLVVLSSTTSADTESLEVRYYQYQDRYDFGKEALALALSKIDTPYQLNHPTAQTVNEARGELGLLKDHFDVEWISVSEHRNKTLIPIKIPIYRGILGLRLLLVRKESARIIGEVTQLEDLRRFKAGHGTHWKDLNIYKANKLPVHDSVSYKKLFEQLKEKRFDYFARGINEIWGELDANSDHLTIAENVLLYYPYPVFFYVSPKRPQLAQDLEQGLLQSMKDGSFDQLFERHHGKYIEQANLAKRHLIYLDTPDASHKAINFKDDWWLPNQILNR